MNKLFSRTSKAVWKELFKMSSSRNGSQRINFINFVPPNVLKNPENQHYMSISRFSTIVSAKCFGISKPKLMTKTYRLSSTLKKRRMKMNKHKLKKRRKLNRMNTKISRA
mmetsp:Transcript_9084/g.12443  ORF Transcript_9084/g.12443 Transcript_9084/m.12443 type:complete len:110 (-) Transcript_9084:18-347(-)